MPKLYNDSVRDASEKIQWQRDDVAAKIIDFEQAREKQSQRQFAMNKTFRGQRCNTGLRAKIALMRLHL